MDAAAAPIGPYADIERLGTEGDGSVDNAVLDTGPTAEDVRIATIELDPQPSKPFADHLCAPLQSCTSLAPTGEQREQAGRNGLRPARMGLPYWEEVTEVAVF